MDEAGVLLETQLLVIAGFTPLEAIRAATLDAASCLGVERELGSVEVGKRADLLIVDGNPATDIRDLKRIAWVVLGGAPYTRQRFSPPSDRKLVCRSVRARRAPSGQGIEITDRHQPERALLYHASAHPLDWEGNAAREVHRPRLSARLIRRYVTTNAGGDRGRADALGPDVR
jgi:hypothetical protein